MQTVNSTRHAIHEKLGVNINARRTAVEALTEANANFEVGLKPLYTSQGDPIPNNFGIYRTDKEHEIEGFLGSCKQKYTPIQTIDAMEFGNAIVGASDGKAFYESVGVLGKGERICALINLQKNFSVAGAGDSYDSYACLKISHDGNSSNEIFLIILRGKCQNTLRVRINAGVNKLMADAGIKIRHTKNAEQRMRMAMRFLSQASESIDDVQAKLKELSLRDINSGTLNALQDRLFPLPPERLDADYDADKDAARTRIVNRRNAFLELFERNDDGELQLISGTAYNALNAYTEFVDHEIAVVETSAKKGWTKEVIRAERALFGNGAVEKEKALDAILEVTKNAPRRTDGSRIFIPGGSLLDAVIDNSRYVIN